MWKADAEQNNVGKSMKTNKRMETVSLRTADRRYEHQRGCCWVAVLAFAVLAGAVVLLRRKTIR